MSADSWAICPKCLAKHHAVAAGLAEKARAAYGNVPLLDFMRMSEDAASVKTTGLTDSTLAEYKYVGPDDDKFVVHYQAVCQTCGYRLEYNLELPLSDVEKRKR